MICEAKTSIKEFIDFYSFKDSKEVYTNGSELIQVFRVKQMLNMYVPKWIPCSERLPGNIETVLVTVREIEKPTIGWYGNIDGWRLLDKEFCELKDFNVIAWMPLPEPYKE